MKKVIIGMMIVLIIVVAIYGYNDRKSDVSTDLNPQGAIGQQSQTFFAISK